MSVKTTQLFYSKLAKRTEVMRPYLFSPKRIMLFEVCVVKLIHTRVEGSTGFSFATFGGAQTQVPTTRVA